MNLLPSPNSASPSSLSGLIALIAGLLIPPIADLTAADPPTSAKPNIVYLLVDDMVCHGRKGRDISSCRAVVAKVRAEGRSGGAYVPWGALMFAEPPKEQSESKQRTGAIKKAASEKPLAGFVTLSISRIAN